MIGRRQRRARPSQPSSSRTRRAEEAAGGRRHQGPAQEQVAAAGAAEAAGGVEAARGGTSSYAATVAQWAPTVLLAGEGSAAEHRGEPAEDGRERFRSASGQVLEAEGTRRRDCGEGGAQRRHRALLDV